MKKGVIKIVTGILILLFIVIAIFEGISYKNKKIIFQSLSMRLIIQ